VFEHLPNWKADLAKIGPAMRPGGVRASPLGQGRQDPRIPCPHGAI